MKKFFLNLFLCFFSIAFAIFICELGIRFFLSNQQSGEETRPQILLHRFSPDNLKLLYKPIPGARNQAYGVENHINNLGFRGAEIDKTLKQKEKRIVFLGDSVVYGYGLGENETIPVALENELADTEVLNLGVSGYDTVQAVEFFKDTGHDLNPDLVILGYTLNDSIYASMELDFFHDQEDVYVKAPREELRKMIIKFLYDHSALMNYLDKIFQLQMRFGFFRYYRVKSVYHFIEDRNKEYRDKPDSEYQMMRGVIESDAKRLGTSSQGLKNMLGFLGIGNSDMWSSHWGLAKQAAGELAEIARQRGIKLAVAIFPYGVELDAYALAEAHRFLSAEFESMGYQVIDLMPAVVDRVKNDELKTDSIYLDPIHFNKDGAELIAKEIARQITQV